MRPGIMLYGSSPCEDVTARDAGLKPVMTLQSALISVHDVKAGEFTHGAIIRKLIRRQLNILDLCVNQRLIRRGPQFATSDTGDRP